jgi:acylglycerol lipase
MLLRGSIVVAVLAAASYWLQLHLLFESKHALPLSQADKFDEETYFRNPHGLLIHFRPLGTFPPTTTSAGASGTADSNATPVEHLKGVVLLVHGYAESMSYYETVADKLRARGFVSYAIDHAGHGLSQGDPGYVRDVEELATDVLFLARKLKAKHPHLPLLLYGHSMGGAVSILAAASASGKELFRGVYLEAPLIQLHESAGAPWKRLVANALSWLPKLRLPAAKLDRSRITRTPWLRDMWDKDKTFYHGHTYIGTGLAMMRVEEQIEALLKTGRISFPFFIATGDDDVACDYRGSVTFYERAASKEKKLKVYPGMSHTLKYDSEEAVQDMLDYFESLTTTV